MTVTDYENYLKTLFFEMHSIIIGDETVQYYNKSGWFLTYEKGDKEFWLKGEYFREIKKTFTHDNVQSKELCTELLNYLLGTDAISTNYSDDPIKG